ncbi:hypothetical protein SAMN05216332_11140 [Nitrosospira briensis]|nr:hypothetical protein SAMN05216332_11140 [Nitrosospira briensis]
MERGNGRTKENGKTMDKGGKAQERITWGSPTMRELRRVLFIKRVF